MAKHSEYADYLLEQLQALGGISIKRMFGGYCFLKHDLAFAILPNDSLYFVVDEQTRPQYEQAGMHNFAYDNKKGRIQVKRYYAVPEEVLADTDTLQAWARTAIQSAQRTPTKTSKRKPKTIND